MPDSPPDRVLVDLWRRGDQQAAQQLLDRYVDRLVALSRRRICEQLSLRIDPEDVVLSVFRTFFAHARDGEFHIDDQDDLCKLLMRITVRKTLRQVAFHRAEKRDVRRELAHGTQTQIALEEMLSRTPSSEEIVMFLDQLEHFLQRLKPQERQILELRMQGYGTEEIAAKLGIYDRKVRRMFERIRDLASEEGLGS